MRPIQTSGPSERPSRSGTGRVHAAAMTAATATAKSKEPPR